jgi:hypothetical protein
VHPRSVFIARVLVPDGVLCHQGLHPPLHKTKGHIFGP